MKRLYKIIILSLLFAIIGVNVFAFESQSKEEINGILTLKFDIKQSEEQEFLDYIKDNIQVDNKNYEYIRFEKSDDKENKKEIDKTVLKENLNSGDKQKIKAMAEPNYEYMEDGYSGILEISSIDIDTKSNGQYEEIESLDIPIVGLNSNDLNNIEKELIQGDKTYYLINANWENDETQEIDGTIIPNSYKGILHYETVTNKNFPNTYNAIITYSGEVSADDELYHYTVTYKEIIPEIEEIVVPEEKNNIVVPIIIVSAIGIVLIVVLIITKKRKTGGKNDKARRYL